MSAHSNTVTVRVPGSTSNCGAGFDTLGLALKLYNRVTLGPTPGVSPDPERAVDARAREMVTNATRAFFQAAGRKPVGFNFRIEGDVPYARGLGSSVTVIAGVLAGLNAIHKTGLSPHQLVALATEQEGHPDNASAGILGGFCVSRCDPETGAYRDTIRFEVPPDVAFVVASPAHELLTKESRGALPATLPFFDAVKSVNSAAYLVAAFASGNYSKLHHASGEFLHEPYRLPKIPGGRAAIEAGIEAGAYTGWLSGSGSSVLCVCASPEGKTVADAMRSAFDRAGVMSEGRILEADNRGLTIE